MIVGDLRPLAVDIERVHNLEGNPRRGDVEAIARSLDRFGQRKPIIARKDGTIIAGNHTLLAARQLGWTELAVVWVDDDDATAKGYALADNRTAELGDYDSVELLAMMRDVAADLDLLTSTGYAEKDLTRLLAQIDREYPTAPDAFAEINPDDLAIEHRCPACGYEWS